MEEAFQMNNVKPGDAGFVYDKRIDFSKQAREDNSWDEGMEDEDVDDYFDDDFQWHVLFNSIHISPLTLHQK